MICFSYDSVLFPFFSHVASTAAGNTGVSVLVNGFLYGRASGMAPRAQYVISTVLCRIFIRMGIMLILFLFLD